MNPHSTASQSSGDPSAWLAQALDHACRQALLREPRPATLNQVCAAIADGLDVPLVMLARRHEDGLIEIEATSSENLLWAELQRVPERMDGNITGNGPAAQALRSGAPCHLAVTDEGFVAWRAAAAREQISAASAVPLKSASAARALLAYHRVPAQSPCADALVPIANALNALLESLDALERDRLLSAALTQAGNPALIAEANGSISWCNDAFCKLSGYRLDELIGRNPNMLRSGEHGVSHYRELWSTILSGRPWQGETVDCRRDGETFAAVQTISPVRQNGRTANYIAIYQDVTREKVDQELRELRSGVDTITGPMHRAPLEQLITNELAHGAEVNLLRVIARGLNALDVLGDGARECFSEELEQRLSMLLGAKRVARLAPGDYFAWMPDDPEKLAELAQSLNASLLEPYPLLGELPAIDLRIGRARAPRDGRSVQELLLNADRDLDCSAPLGAGRISSD